MWCRSSVLRREIGDNSSAGDSYTGFDRFGRVVEQKWTDGSASTARDHYTYGYDAGSNRLYRKNELSTSLSELYHANGASANAEYDGLDRLKEMRRGTLESGNGSILDANTSRRQLWTLDGLGNWPAFKDDAGPGDGGGHMAWATPLYDRAGNLLRVLVAGTAGGCGDRCCCYRLSRQPAGRFSADHAAPAALLHTAVTHWPSANYGQERGLSPRGCQEFRNRPVRPLRHLSAACVRPDLYDRTPSLSRPFTLAELLPVRVTLVGDQGLEGKTSAHQLEVRLVPRRPAGSS